MRERLSQSPDSPGRKCFVCGPENPKGLQLEFFRRDQDTVTAELVPPAEWCGWDGLMHGGFQSLLLDEVTSWTVTAISNHDQYLTTSIQIRFRKPVRLDQKLTVIGRIIKQTHRGSRVLGQILNNDGLVLAEAEARIVHIDEKRFSRIMGSAP